MCGCVSGAGWVCVFWVCFCVCMYVREGVFCMEFGEVTTSSFFLM